MKKILTIFSLFFASFLMVGVVGAATDNLCYKDSGTGWVCDNFASSENSGAYGNVTYFNDSGHLDMHVELYGLQPNTKYQLSLNGRDGGDGNSEIGNNCFSPNTPATWLGYDTAWECGTWSNNEGFWNFDMDAETNSDGNYVGDYELSLPSGHYGPAGSGCDNFPNCNWPIGFIVKNDGDSPSWTPQLMEENGLEFTIYDSTCKLIMDEPEKDEYFDSEPVPIEWHLEGACDSVVYFNLFYQNLTNGECDPKGSWYNITTFLPSGVAANPSFPNYNYTWDKPPESGQYCAYIEVHSAGAKNYSEIFNVDLAKPEISIVGIDYSFFGDCEDGEGECYVNNQSEIRLGCSDTNPSAPWQSGVDYKEYRYNLNNSGNWTEWMTYPAGGFSFPEDSNHTLEYRCFDKIGKESETKSKIFIVDSIAPEISKEIIGPRYGDCPPESNSDDVCHIDGVTEIRVKAVDPEPHPVNDVNCVWGYYWKDNWYGSGYSCDGSDCLIQFPEESEHELYVMCEDALGNSFTDIETFYVDKSAPVTDKWVDGPIYVEDGVHYIDGVTTISMSATDYPIEHASGVNKTFYRVELVGDDYCWGNNETPWKTTSKDSGDWSVYNEPFGIDEESCHVVEYYSVDNVEKSEDVQTWFVFVDKTAPVLHKEVGEPSHDCNGLWESGLDAFGEGKCEENWDWLITMGTPIDIRCEDSEPHPSGVDKLCYRVTLDGEVQEEDYYLDGGEFENDDYYCIPSDSAEVVFMEESEHELDFYCVDNVGKTSNVDSEMFKVQGTPFDIDLKKKWNLISVPFSLNIDNVSEVFEDINESIEIVWMYDEDGWHFYEPEASGDIETIEPGYGYWVKAKEDTTLIVGGSLLSPGDIVPPSRELQEGWNLIGHYGLATRPSYCSLFSLVDTSIGYPRWSALFGYDANTDEFISLSSVENTTAGEGYWLEMDVVDNYSPSSVCWGLPLI